MATSRIFSNRGIKLQPIKITIKDEGDNLDFLSFVETEAGVMYEDKSGHLISLKDVFIENQTGSFELQTVVKNRLAKKMCKVLGETENYYIVKADK